MSDDAQGILVSLGANIEIARTRRRLKISTVCSRAGITSQTYQRLKRGDGGISLAVLMNVLNALDMASMMSLVAAPEQDHVGLALERAAAPERIRKEGEGDGQLDPNW
ncbi:helix-turn-helix domain-containing protein [Pseudomonas sp. MWU12-2323]|uniref:helix-turn-helix domain-containing protein n=1 Tax=Pseudomonas sp. MWU12-2323 TaxID=2651296 RepID=UPI0021156E88|nr:helix-turn-helix domain-containing protein [Pseudomonas sp. MWU12-2323]